MPNFVDDPSQTLPVNKVDRRKLPTGADPKEYFQPSECNQAMQAILDIRDRLNSGLVAMTGTPPSAVGDILVWDGSGWDVLATGGAGFDGWILTADSTDPLGVRWAPAPGGTLQTVYAASPSGLINLSASGYGYGGVGPIILRDPLGSGLDDAFDVRSYGMGANVVDKAAVENLTAATATVQEQYSPALAFRGSVWWATTGTPWLAQVSLAMRPIPGTPPIPELVLWEAYDVSGPTEMLSFSRGRIASPSGVNISLEPGNTGIVRAITPGAGVWGVEFAAPYPYIRFTAGFGGSAEIEFHNASTIGVPTASIQAENGTPPWLRFAYAAGATPSADLGMYLGYPGYRWRGLYNGGPMSGGYNDAGDADHPLTPVDFIVAMQTSVAPRTATLPLAASVLPGQMFIIKDTGGNAAAQNIVVATTALETIDGAASVPINTNYGVLRCTSDGVSAWYTI